MRRFKSAGDFIAVVIPVLQALPKILDLLFLILLCAERLNYAAPRSGVGLNELLGVRLMRAPVQQIQARLALDGVPGQEQARAIEGAGVQQAERAGRPGLERPHALADHASADHEM